MSAPLGSRARVISAVKWTVTLVLLVFVLRKLPLRSLADRLGHMSLAAVGALVAINFVMYLMSTARWWRLLHRLGEKVRFRDVFGDATVGSLYNFLLPGAVGGDVVRSLRMRARIDTGAHAWSSSLYERVVGLFVMALTASVGAGLGLDATIELPSWIRDLTFGITALLAIGILVAAHPFRILLRFVGRRLPEPARRDLSGIHADLSGPLRTVGARAETFAWSLVYQATNLVGLVVGAAALGAPGHEMAILIGAPIVFVLTLIPITVGGHGLREGLYVGILGALGLPGEVALGLSGIYVVACLVFSGIGALYLFLDPVQVPKAATSP
jgi:uncharacterized membrane protein YbhN (UPF0104 family)